MLIALCHRVLVGSAHCPSIGTEQAFDEVVDELEAR